MPKRSFDLIPKGTRVTTFLTAMFLTINVVAQAQLPLTNSDEPVQKHSTSVDTVSRAPELPQQQPYKRKYSGPLRTVTTVAAGATLWSAAYALMDEPAQKYTQSHQNSVTNGISKLVEPLGHVTYLAPVAGAATIGGILAKDPKLEKAGLLSLGSMLAGSLVTNALKSSVNRHRPMITTQNHFYGGPDKEWNYTSFPSGHTTVAFAVATSVATVYKDHKFVPPVAYGVATLVGLSRIHDNAHWATDVMAGAAVGFLTAKGLNKLYDAAEQKLKIRKQKLLISPQFGLRLGGLSTTLVF
ncbi:phosphatase PAP2 family protein [Pontibacter silvestris]|uniref:Phosphatase PAP2 family protein n=1 Tax=Pontibacter silvestris TaxID=2305183 RepID=A0ABW4WUH9_9BACT|nr:phosphatase PAP2 family protein [Pontibacter silvestris]MCC9137863.1 phosphatase PAP2 family protein [Pontibacter silvestris]